MPSWTKSLDEKSDCRINNPARIWCAVQQELRLVGGWVVQPCETRCNWKCRIMECLAWNCENLPHDWWEVYNHVDEVSVFEWLSWWALKVHGVISKIRRCVIRTPCGCCKQPSELVICTWGSPLTDVVEPDLWIGSSFWGSVCLACRSCLSGIETESGGIPDPPLILANKKKPCRLFSGLVVGGGQGVVHACIWGVIVTLITFACLNMTHPQSKTADNSPCRCVCLQRKIGHVTMLHLK